LVTRYRMPTARWHPMKRRPQPAPMLGPFFLILGAIDPYIRIGSVSRTSWYRPSCRSTNCSKWNGTSRIWRLQRYRISCATSAETTCDQPSEVLKETTRTGLSRQVCTGRCLCSAGCVSGHQDLRDHARLYDVRSHRSAAAISACRERPTIARGKRRELAEGLRCSSGSGVADGCHDDPAQRRYRIGDVGSATVNPPGFLAQACRLARYLGNSG
jgi:hypothetical protein